MATLPELWARLRENAPSPAGDNGLRLLLRTSAHGARLYAGLDTANGLLAVVLEISGQARPRDLAKISTRTFDAQLATFPGLPQGRVAIAVVLKAVDFEDLFSILGEEMVRAVEESPSEAEAAKAVVARIERWRRFVERGRRRLSEEEVRGLLGELAVLARAMTKLGMHAALDAWQGGGGLRDFEFAGFAVEVKTHQAAAGATVRVSDPGQLEPSANRPLLLATLQLSLVENKGWTLGDAARRVAEVCAPDESALEKFWDRLADQGFLAEHDRLYPERYMLDRLRLFRVADGFPRITCSSVPAGVDAVHFSVRLAAIQQFSEPADGVLGSDAILEATT